MWVVCNNFWSCVFSILRLCSLIKYYGLCNMWCRYQHGQWYKSSEKFYMRTDSINFMRTNLWGLHGSTYDQISTLAETSMNWQFHSHLSTTHCWIPTPVIFKYLLNWCFGGLKSILLIIWLWWFAGIHNPFIDHHPFLPSNYSLSFKWVPVDLINMVCKNCAPCMPHDHVRLSMCTD